MRVLQIIFFFLISVPICFTLLAVIELRFFIHRVVLVFLGHDKGKYPAVSTVGVFKKKIQIKKNARKKT